MEAASQKDGSDDKTVGRRLGEELGVKEQFKLKTTPVPALAKTTCKQVSIVARKCSGGGSWRQHGPLWASSWKPCWTQKGFRPELQDAFRLRRGRRSVLRPRFRQAQIQNLCLSPFGRRG